MLRQKEKESIAPVWECDVCMEIGRKASRVNQTHHTDIDSVINTWEAHHESHQRKTWNLDIKNTAGGTKMKNTLEYGPQPGVDNTPGNSTSNETQLIVI